MNTLKLILAAFFISLLPAILVGQQKPDRFTIGQYSFQINLPPKASNVENDLFRLLEFEVYGETIVWEREGTRLASIGIYHPFKRSSQLTEIDKVRIITEYVKEIIAAYQKQKLITANTPYAFMSSKGTEIRASGDSQWITRIFFVGRRLFQVTVNGDESPGFEQPAVILDSFRPLTKKETIAALKAENDIEELLQKPMPMRLGSDVQDHGLKGNVCSVVDEVTTASEKTREMDHETYFDVSGNLLHEIKYQLGYPQEITRWGWLDGKRISSTRIIFFEPLEPINRFPTTIGPSTGMMGNSGRFSLFGLRHEFKYDAQGRVTEQKAYKSDGNLNWTKKFTNSATGREILTLDATGGFLTRIVETFDKNGNIAEYKILDMSGKPFSTTRNQYEFDQGGNWVVRRTFKAGAPSKTAKPLSTVYRTITYCDSRTG